MEDRPEYFAVHCELQDAADHPTLVELAPAAAAIELAKLLTRFDDQIDDEWRSEIILIGGGLIRLERQTDAGAGCVEA